MPATGGRRFRRTIDPTARSPRAPSDRPERAGRSPTPVDLITVVVVVAAALATTALAGAAERSSTPTQAAVPVVAAEAPGPRPRATAAGRACRHPWSAPVEAPVTDPFRRPDHRYGPGNRGLEYGTEAGDPVRAVDAGLVTFAGPVGGAPVVVIDHGGGLRSSYVRLVEVAVDRGDPAARGQQIGRADERFHLGARRADTYLDPADLIDHRCAVVRLVPIDGAG